MIEKKKNYILLTIIILAAVLRFYKISEIPPGLYWDEVSIGYNAYSILKTGKDEYGKSLPLIFGAFGEYKLPVYIYLTSASINIFGLTDFAVRFPSAFAGTLSVLITYFLVIELFKDSTSRFLSHNSRFIALMAALLLAISPWHLQFSRGAFEANLALLFLLTAIVTFFRALQKNPHLLSVSMILLVLATATYNSMRLFAPLLTTALLLLYRKRLKNIKRKLVTAGIVGLLISLPFLPQFLSGKALIRAHSESIFNKGEPVNSFFSNYFSYFDTTFLFFRGDQTGRHSVRKLGMLYLFELPLIVFGIRRMMKEKRLSQGSKVLFSWILLAPIPASLTKVNPHALRSFNILPVWHIFSAIGLTEFTEIIKSKVKRSLSNVIILALTLSVFYNVFLYLHQYYVHNPKQTAPDWQNGYKETVSIIKQKYNNYDQIFVNEYLLPVYIGFYFPISPRDYQKTNAKEAIGKMQYFKNAWEIENLEGSKTLIIAPSWQKPAEGTEYQEIKMINGDTIFNIWEEGNGRT
jgi:4-amino-4-deoxy-L-arabinose transferase-like glycosyltransferase